MNPEDSTIIGSSTEELFEDTHPPSQNSPEAGKTPPCTECKYPQPEEPGSELPEEDVEQDETPEVVGTQQCPNCDLLQTEEEPTPDIELYCACSNPDAAEHGIPIAPEQVLAQYNSRPPLLIETRPGRAVPTAPIQIKPNPGRPVYHAPIQIRPDHAQPVHVAPIPINTCSRRPAYAAPILNNPNPAHPGCAAPKRH
jgi:hypothetical protein